MALQQVVDRGLSVLSERRAVRVKTGAGADLADAVTIPNAISIAGLVASAWWLAGGSGWFAVAGLVADELDGRVARAIGQTSELGSHLDWAGDIAMNGAVLAKMGAPYVLALPAVIAGQAVLRNNGWRPPIGSARAVTTLLALWKDGFFSRKAAT